MGTFNERKDFIAKRYQRRVRDIRRMLGTPAFILESLGGLECISNVEISLNDKAFLLYRAAILPSLSCVMYYNFFQECKEGERAPILGVFDASNEMNDYYLSMERFILAKEDRKVWVEGEVLDTSGQFIKLKDYRTNEIAVTKLPHVSGSMNVIINKGESVRVFDNGDVEKFGPPLIIPLGPNGGLYKSEPC